MIVPPASALGATALGPVDHASHPAYAERVYAGVLGKLIGVYLGRPVENWSQDRIEAEFGEITYYVHEKRARRLIVTDDDISGTLTFLRALEDYGYDRSLSPEQIGRTWLNYLIEEKTILWWGGLGNSTEHTAYIRLKNGIPAPRSGSAALNSRIVSEQIGSQIFIDGWGLVNPGDPERAADFARRAASVSHDGEAVYGAQVVAAMIALAFVRSDIEQVVMEAAQLVPADSVIRRLIDDLHEGWARGDSWREARAFLAKSYGYDRFVGNCHLVPNHGLVIMSLLHGQASFDESMMMVNTSGWDTDCNSGNVGAVLGVLGGLAGLEGQDWRGPVADRLYLPSADPGRSITDAVAESLAVANAGRALVGLPKIAPKEGAKFHFSFPGSVQGWRCPETPGAVYNASRLSDEFGTGLVVDATRGSVKASTPTFIPPEFKDVVTGYVLVSSPTLYPGQTVQVRLRSVGQTSIGRIYLTRYDENDESVVVPGPDFSIPNGGLAELIWTVPELGGYPIHELGIELQKGKVVVDAVDWGGVPTTSWPPVQGTMWARAWAQAVDRFQFQRDAYEFITHNDGVGLLIQGHREWDDYRVTARLTPRMATSAGIAVRCQGMRRYYAFVFGDAGEIRLDKMDHDRVSLAKVAFPWKPFQDYKFCVEVSGTKLRLIVDGELLLQVTDDEAPIASGAVAFLVESGCFGAGTPSIEPLKGKLL